jgi:hypothetical protein
VVGKFADAASGIVSAQRLDRLGDRAMGSGASRRGELVVQRPFNERVGEAVPVDPVTRAQHPSRVAAVDHGVFVDVGDPGEKPDVEVASDHGG